MKRTNRVLNVILPILSLLACRTPVSFGDAVPEERRIQHREKSLLDYEPFEAEELWERISIPPAPALTPQQALESFRIAEGFRIECAASEPLVEDPVMFEFDPDGRIWVVEMRGWMRDIEGTGEADPTGRIVVLEDLDGDSFMDKSTVFLDELVMPRTLSFVDGGVLVAEPPKLWYCRDLNGDLECDWKEVVGEYGEQGNPEHTANALMPALDNWMYNANLGKRHRFRKGRLIEEETYQRGQWGMTQDDHGRLMFNYENRSLFCDLVPSHYLFRNPNYRRRGEGRAPVPGLHEYIGKEANEVYPIRVTPGITLGGNELREDGTLRTFTISCGPTVYRGDQFPEECYGNVFIPEAGGNLVRRDLLKADGIRLEATNAYHQSEFLASTDERFRPVNSRTGPDGALYLCDFYRGIIEHVIYLMPYLRHQILSRGLDRPVGLGRIYRIVHEAKPLGPKPNLSEAPSTDLVRGLAHPNGWWRDTSQRLLVERRDSSVIPALEELAVRGPTHQARIHALWTLSGMEVLRWETVREALADSDEWVRVMALRLSKGFLSGHHGRVVEDHILALGGDESQAVRLQLVLSLGESRSEKAESAMAGILQAEEDPIFHAAAVSGLEGRELRFLLRLLALDGWAEETEGRWNLCQTLSMAVFNEGLESRVFQLLEEAASQGEKHLWRRRAILRGILESRKAGERWPVPLKLQARPRILSAVGDGTDPQEDRLSEKLLRIITWPGDATVRERKPVASPLSQEREARRRAGKAYYMAACLACHEADGRGKLGQAPPLVDSEWVTGSPETLIRIVLHGLRGPVSVGGATWNLEMPGHASNPILTDDGVAAVLTFIRREWGHTADPIDPDLVETVRKLSGNRSTPWTVPELLNPRDSSAFQAVGESTMDPMEKYREALTGGDVSKGERIFHAKRTLQCLACHVIRHQGGGFAGPDLSSIGDRATREYLLESLVKPSERIVDGFQTILVTRTDGELISGTLVSDTSESLTLSPPSGGKMTIPYDEIEERRNSSLSSMPPVANLLSVEEMRDLLAYLESLKAESGVQPVSKKAEVP